MYKISVLVVDNDYEYQEVVVEALTLKGMHVDAVDSAQEALSKLSEHSYDVLLADFHVQAIPGSGVIDHVIDNCPETEVIMLTSDNQSLLPREERIKARECLEKPFPTNVLAQIVQFVALGRDPNQIDWEHAA